MQIWDELQDLRGVRYRLGRTGSSGNRKLKGGGGVKKTRNTSGESLAGLNPGEALNSMEANASSLGAWGYIYQIGAQTIAVGSNVTYSNNGPLNGINHTPDDSTIEVTMGGTYNIVFSIYTNQNNPQDWAVVVNGLPKSRFTSAGQTMNAATTITLEAMDRVTIRNVDTIPDPATLRTGDVTTAYVMIYKVDD